MRIEHSGTNVAQHYQILHRAVRLQVAHAEDNFTERGGSSDYNKQAFVDSWERAVFLIAEKKWTCYIILHRNWELENTKGCGLNLSGPVSGQLSVFGEQKSSLDLKEKGAFINLQRIITKQFVLCGITVQLMPELLKILLELTIIGVGIYSDR